MEVVIFTLQETVEEMFVCKYSCAHVHLYVFMYSVFVCAQMCLCVHKCAHMVGGGQRLLLSVFFNHFPLSFRKGSLTDTSLTASA